MTDAEFAREGFSLLGKVVWMDERAHSYRLGTHKTRGEICFHRDHDDTHRGWYRSKVNYTYHGAACLVEHALEEMLAKDDIVINGESAPDGIGYYVLNTQSGERLSGSGWSEHDWNSFHSTRAALLAAARTVKEAATYKKVAEIKAFEERSREAKGMING